MPKAKKKTVRRAAPKRGELPHVMSELITIALKDLKKAEKTKGYVVDMSDWHSQDELECRTSGGGDLIRTEKVCSVCFAGSVMAFSLKVKKDAHVEPNKFGTHNANAFYALNNLREGDVTGAAGYLGIDREGLYDFNRGIAEYEYMDSKPFHDDMAKLAKDLKKAGY